MDLTTTTKNETLKQLVMFFFPPANVGFFKRNTVLIHIPRSRGTRVNHALHRSFHR